MMKVPTILFLYLLVLKVDAQNKFVGRYHDFFASTIVINSDSTFKYEFHFDLESSWSKGTWMTNKDTIYFNVIFLFDTLKYLDTDGTLRDSLVLSLDETAEQITLDETQLLYSGGQERHPCPKKLYFKHNKYYFINPDGKLVTQKFSWANKKIAPWFVRSYKE